MDGISGYRKERVQSIDREENKHNAPNTISSTRTASPHRGQLTGCSAIEWMRKDRMGIF